MNRKSCLLSSILQRILFVININKEVCSELIYREGYNSFLCFGNLGTGSNESILGEMKKHGKIISAKLKVYFQ